MLKNIKRWYQGEKIYPFSDQTMPVFPGERYKRHWSSLFAHRLVEFYLKEWKWLLPFFIGLVGLILTIIFNFKG